MAEDLQIRIPVKLGTENVLSEIDGIKKTIAQDSKYHLNVIAKISGNSISVIQEQLSALASKKYEVNIGTSVSNIQGQMSQVQNNVANQISKINNKAVVKPTIDISKTELDNLNIMTNAFVKTFDIKKLTDDAKNQLQSLMRDFQVANQQKDLLGINKAQTALENFAQTYGKAFQNVEAITTFKDFKTQFQDIGLAFTECDQSIKGLLGSAKQIREVFGASWTKLISGKGGVTDDSPIWKLGNTLDEIILNYRRSFLSLKEDAQQTYTTIEQLSQSDINQLFARIANISSSTNLTPIAQEIKNITANFSDMNGVLQLSETFFKQFTANGTNTSSLDNILSKIGLSYNVVADGTNNAISSISQFQTLFNEVANAQKKFADGTNQVVNAEKEVSNSTQKSNQIARDKISVIEQTIKASQEQTTALKSMASEENKANSVSDHFRASFSNFPTQIKLTTNAINEAKNAFIQYGEVSASSNKSTVVNDIIPEHFSSFIVKVKSATGEVQRFKYAFQNLGTNDAPNFKYVLTNINEADAGIKKLADDIAKAKAEAQKTMAAFDNKTQGKFVDLSVYKNAKNALESITDFDSISKFNNAMSELEAHYQNITKYTRSSNKSLNPFINAVNDMAGIDEEIKRIKLSAEGLQGKSKSLIGSLGSLNNMASKVRNYAVGTEEWASAYEKLKNKMAQVKDEIKTLRMEQKVESSYAQKQQSMYSVIEQRMKQINNLKIQQLNTDKNTASIMQKQIDAYERQISSKNANISKYGYKDTESEKRLDNLRKELDYNLQIAQSKAQYKADTQSQKDMAKNIEQVDKYATSIEKAINNLNKLKSNGVFTKNFNNSIVQAQVGEIDSLIAKFSTFFTKVQAVQNTIKSTGIIDSTQVATLSAELSTLTNEYNKVTSSVKNFQTELRQTNGQQAQEQKNKVLIAQLEAYAAANSKAMKSNQTLKSGLTPSQEINNMLTALKAGADSSDWSKIQSNFKIVRSEIKALGLEGGTIFQNLWAQVKKFSRWMGITMVTTSIAREIRGLFTDVAELDTALVDLRKTFKGTSEDLEEFYYDANNIAKQLGVATKEVINQASAWSRLGFSTKETAIEMSKMSSIFASISPDMDTEEATDGLLSIIKAFDIDVNDVLDGVISKVNKVGNEFGTSNGEVVNMLTRSSSAMKEANNTLEETIALETAAVEITRDAESVGTAYKTLSMRLRGYDETTEEYSNDVEVLSGKIADLTKTASTPGGISLFTDETKTTYKSTVQLLREISAIYDDLSDKTQAELLEVLAGKRQGQIVAATLNNWETVEKALTAMSNADGSAMQEMEVIMDSVDYKANKLKETFLGIGQDAISRDFLKSILDSATRLLETVSDTSSPLGIILNSVSGIADIVSNIVKNIGLIPTIFAGLSLKNVGEQNKHARFCTATHNKYRECNTFQNKVVKLLGNAKTLQPLIA